MLNNVVAYPLARIHAFASSNTFFSFEALKLVLSRTCIIWNVGSQRVTNSSHSRSSFVSPDCAQPQGQSS
jgi:hypothetical protein